MEFIHQYILLNGKISPNTLENHNSQLTVYEVIRIIESIPIFLKEHYQRLLNSAALLNKSVQFSLNDLENQIDILSEVSDVRDGNVKLIANYGEEVIPSNYMIGFIPHNYPAREDYKNGIKIVTIESERPNPNAKVVHNELREKYNRIIKEKNVYEAILLNKNKEITEGSRSNIFFIKDGEIITAPEKDVLAGITRGMVISVIKSAGIPIWEKLLNISQIAEMDAAFITGTSPKVLPIKQFNNTIFEINNFLLNKISQQYDQLIEAYIVSHQKNKGAQQ